jgi:hypothetical protein
MYMSAGDDSLCCDKLFWHGRGTISQVKSLSGMQHENSSQHSTTFVLSR